MPLACSGSTRPMARISAWSGVSRAMWTPSEAEARSLRRPHLFVVAAGSASGQRANTAVSRIQPASDPPARWTSTCAGKTRCRPTARSRTSGTRLPGGAVQADVVRHQLPRPGDAVQGSTGPITSGYGISPLEPHYVEPTATAVASAGVVGGRWRVGRGSRCGGRRRFGDGLGRGRGRLRRGGSPAPFCDHRGPGSACSQQAEHRRSATAGGPGAFLAADRREQVAHRRDGTA
jgi:hypothetical protein